MQKVPTTTRRKYCFNPCTFAHIHSAIFKTTKPNAAILLNFICKFTKKSVLLIAFNTETHRWQNKNVSLSHIIVNELEKNTVNINRTHTMKFMRVILYDSPRKRFTGVDQSDIIQCIGTYNITLHQQRFTLFVVIWFLSSRAEITTHSNALTQETTPAVPPSFSPRAVLA